MDDIQGCFRGVDFSCHGVASCLVVGWETLVFFRSLNFES